MSVLGSCSLFLSLTLYIICFLSSKFFVCLCLCYAFAIYGTELGFSSSQMLEFFFFFTLVKCIQFGKQKGWMRRSKMRVKCYAAASSASFLVLCVVKDEYIIFIHRVVNIFKCTHSTRAYFTGENGCKFFLLLFCFRFDLVLVVLDVTMQYIYFSLFI